MIVTRFPPSPTGNFHIGSARTAFYNWLLARQNGGRFILRIEDTDTERSTRLYEKDIMDSLARLDIDFDAGLTKEDDKGPYRQMERLDIYQKYTQMLIDKGVAYEAWETPEELEQMRSDAYAQKKAFIYKKIEYTPEQIADFKADANRKSVIRFVVQDRVVKWNDAVKGDIALDASNIGDFVIMKSDGVPTYYLANVVDDYLMGVTHIIRGEDHVNNTPKQILLYEAYGWDVPVFGHLPLMLNQDKSKMSKRDTDNQYVSLLKFREEGFLKEALLNFIVLLGWHPSDDREIFSVDDLIKEFKIDRIGSSNAIYDFKRALWFNSEYLKNLSDEEFVSRVKEYLLQYGDSEWKSILDITEQEYWLKLAPYIKVRLQTFGQFRDFAKYFFKRQFPTDEMLYNPKMNVDKDVLLKVLEVTKSLEKISESDWTEENLKNILMDFIQQSGLKNGQVLWPLRAILTGASASPGAFEMLYVLGKTESIERLNTFCESQSKK